MMPSMPFKTLINPPKMIPVVNPPVVFYTVIRWSCGFGRILAARAHTTSVSLVRQANIAGHQFLFAAGMAPGSMPAFCLRHDVDGLLWQPRPNSDGVSDAPWQHVATFNALGKYMIVDMHDPATTRVCRTFNVNVVFSHPTRTPQVMCKPQRVTASL